MSSTHNTRGSRHPGQHRERGGGGGGAHRRTQSYNNNGSDKSNTNKKPTIVRATTDIYSFESPKAFAPLGYLLPQEPHVLEPANYDIEKPLPTYPQQPIRIISQALKCTFEDTEAAKPGSTPARRLVNRSMQKSSRDLDPLTELINLSKTEKAPLKLGDKLLTEVIKQRGVTIGGHSTGPRPRDRIVSQKRERELDHDDGSEVKRAKREVRIKFDGEDEPDINNDTIKPENVLRMVDSSLVDTPERPRVDQTTSYNPATYRKTLANTYSGSPMPAGSRAGSDGGARYDYDYYSSGLTAAPVNNGQRYDQRGEPPAMYREDPRASSYYGSGGGSYRAPNPNEVPGSSGSIPPYMRNKPYPRPGYDQDQGLSHGQSQGPGYGPPNADSRYYYRGVPPDHQAYELQDTYDQQPRPRDERRPRYDY